MEKMINNNVTVTGIVTTGFEYNHEVLGERFYRMTVAVERNSGTDDLLPVLVSERLVDVTQSLAGKQVTVEGQFRSFNMHEENKSRLVLLIFAREVAVLTEEAYDFNSITLNGFICKTPTYRTTPLGREICDVLVAVNRSYGKSDYIPCIVWGRNARYFAEQKAGTQIELSGRIQSRNYEKKFDTYTETRTAYEVSVAKLEVIKEAEAEEETEKC